ncbi:glutamate receptor 2-like [Physella acuta]|uniref:glutamate receptor 2-like n=1 Tax=Physella acuta TaxID=109671 RepID=UPI0027DEAA4A|nr:glutamate receptor 2-like [Physella acuta]
MWISSRTDRRENRRPNRRVNTPELTQLVTQGRDMRNVVFHLLLHAALALAYTHNIPIGIIVDSSESDVIKMLEQVIHLYNTRDPLSARLHLQASWFKTSMDNNCDLIKAICKRLDQGVVLLLGSSTSRTYNIIQSYSHALQVPYIVYSQTINNENDGYDYDISLSPGYVNAVADVIKFFNWHKVYYVFDSDDALWELQRLHDSFRRPEKGIVIDARRVRNLTSAHDFLRQLDRFSSPASTKRIVLNLSTREAFQAILNQIVDVGMNRENYHYLLSGPYIDSLNLHSFLYGGVNVTGFRLPIDPAQPSPVSIDAALAGDSYRLVVQALKDLLQSSRLTELYNNRTRGAQCWRQPAVPWLYGREIRDAILKTQVKGITGPVRLSKKGLRVDTRLDLMHLQYRTPLRKVGEWAQKDGVLTNMTRPRPLLTLDSNRTRIVTTILENPFFMETCPGGGIPCHRDVKYEGYCVDLLERISRHLNFEYTFKLVEDKNYGTRLPDGSWNGMIGELLNGKADIAIAALTITEVRERFVDFSKPFMNLGTSIMIKKPDKEKGGVFSFKNPLSDGVWVSIICGFVGVSLVLFFVGRFSPYEWDPSQHARGGELSNKPAFNLVNTLWFSLGALMQQGSDIYPRSISGRIVGSAWWFFTLIIISSYTANLAAFLTIERMEIPINSADDLARQTEIRYGIIANGSTEEFFKVSNVTVYNKMWSFMRDAEPSVFVNTTLGGVSRVRESKGKYAFLLDSTFNEYHNQRKPCNTMKVGRDLDVKGYGIATPRGSDLRADINIVVLQLNEIGELLKLYQKWWYDKGQCAAESGKESTTSALSLSNVSGIFHILIGGLVLAMLTAFFDFLIKQRLRRKKNIKVVLKTSASHLDIDDLTQRHYHRPRHRRMSDENGDCRYASLDTAIPHELSQELDQHKCRHRDEIL